MLSLTFDISHFSFKTPGETWFEMGYIETRSTMGFTWFHHISPLCTYGWHVDVETKAKGCSSIKPHYNYRIFTGIMQHQVLRELGRFRRLGRLGGGSLFKPWKPVSTRGGFVGLESRRSNQLSLKCLSWISNCSLKILMFWIFMDFLSFLSCCFYWFKIHLATGHDAVRPRPTSRPWTLRSAPWRSTVRPAWTWRDGATHGVMRKRENSCTAWPGGIRENHWSFMGEMICDSHDWFCGLGSTCVAKPLFRMCQGYCAIWWV